MNEPFEELAGLDRLIHEPASLAIMTGLSSAQSADFLLLPRLTGVTKGNLSSHLSKLEEAGFVQIEKGFVGKTPSTQLSLTEAGREEIKRYWQHLDDVRAEARRWEREHSAAS